MEEILELKALLLKGDLEGSLEIVEELEEMSRDDKISNVISYAIVLLVHLIKQQAEHRTARSWEVSIRNSVRQIRRKNKRRKAGGYYLTPEELRQALEESFTDAIDRAALAVEEGRYQSEELAAMINREELIDKAMKLIEALEE